MSVGSYRSASRRSHLGWPLLIATVFMTAVSAVGGTASAEEDPPGDGEMNTPRVARSDPRTCRVTVVPPVLRDVEPKLRIRIRPVTTSCA